jgi:hypothetical protein
VSCPSRPRRGAPRASHQPAEDVVEVFATGPRRTGGGPSLRAVWRVARREPAEPRGLESATRLRDQAGPPAVTRSRPRAVGSSRSARSTGSAMPSERCAPIC